jgi:hypothetical protein
MVNDMRAGTNIYALCLQPRNETLPVRLGNENDSRTPRLEGYSDKASKLLKMHRRNRIELHEGEDFFLLLPA